MPAFVVFTRERMTDEAEFEIYRQKAATSREGHNITARARYGDFEMLEGDPIDGAVILEFPSVEEAKAWYNSPKYQDAVKHRWAGSDYRVFIIQGVE